MIFDIGRDAAAQSSEAGYRNQPATQSFGLARGRDRSFTMLHLIDIRARCPIEAAEVLRLGQKQPRQHNASIATAPVEAPKFFW